MAMSASSTVGPAAQAGPRHIPDLRPSADAAASTRENRPATAIAVAPVPPPSPTQSAEVSRSMASVAKQTDRTDTAMVSRAEQVLRTLKPYGVAMLPRTEVAEESKKHAFNVDKPRSAPAPNADATPGAPDRSDPDAATRDATDQPALPVPTIVQPDLAPSSDQTMQTQKPAPRPEIDAAPAQKPALRDEPAR